jgi:thymidylate kinase
MQFVCEQLSIMQEQVTFSTNQMKQLSVWEQALNYVVSSPVQDFRLHLIQDLNSFLQYYKHSYIKFDNQALENLPIYSDLDIAIQKKAKNPIVQFIRNHFSIESIQEVKQSFMTTVICTFKDQTQLSIDLVHQFKRRSNEMMNIQPFLRSSQLNKFGVCVPDLRFDVEYCICFYYLNKSEIPQKYRNYFNSFPFSDKMRTLNYLSSKYTWTFQNFDDIFVRKVALTLAIKAYLKKERNKNKIASVKNKFNYIADKTKQITKNQSVTITLSGVDGVGKSTIIDEVIKQIQVKMRREVVLLRHRPRLLPILSSLKHGSVKKAENHASITLPGSGRNFKKSSSYLRFAYYFSDYLFGQMYIFFRYKIKGKVVVYDRYYFDFINHPERSNIRLPKGFTKWFYRFIAKPQLNILLVAESHKIHERKQELTIEKIESLTADYKTLFDEFRVKYPNSRYCTIQNDSIQETANRIIEEIKNVA